MKEAFNEIINENFPDAEKERGNKIQEGQRTLNRLNQKQSSPWHIIIKLSLAEHKDVK